MPPVRFLTILNDSGDEYSKGAVVRSEPVCTLVLTTVNPQVLLQMVLVFEGLATLCTFELAVASPLVQQLVLWKRERERRGCVSSSQTEQSRRVQ